MCDGISSSDDDEGDVGVPPADAANDDSVSDKDDAAAPKKVVRYRPPKSKRPSRAIAKVRSAGEQSVAPRKRVGVRTTRSLVETRKVTEVRNGPKIERTTETRREEQRIVEFVGEFGGSRGVLRGSLSTIGWILQQAGKITPWT
jgi:hypothetical protein